MKKYLIAVMLFVICNFSAKARTYVIVVGLDDASLYNLCIGDTLHFKGDSTGTLASYGTRTAEVYNNITLNYDQFNISSYQHIETSYDHILVAGDSQYNWAGMPVGGLCEYGCLVFNCITTNITDPRQADKFNIAISPNPFTSLTTISFSQEQTNTTIKITDILGKEIKELNFSGKQCNIEKGTMQAGIYFVQITTSAGSVNEKVVNRKVVVQ